VAVHREHHKFAEQPGLDPHTTDDGFWWAHLLWMVLPNPAMKDNILEEFAGPKLMEDRFHRIMHKVWWAPSLVVGAILLIAGWPSPSLLLWGVVVPVTLGWHITWMVNSVTHKWGSRRFNTKDNSRNNWLVAMLTFGEGWHNNHHAHPVSARHGGMAWYEFDMNYLVIRGFEKLGMIRDIKTADLK
jgi:stearoyl-CoA desaturase (delta-9 desaturase)